MGKLKLFMILLILLCRSSLGHGSGNEDGTIQAYQAYLPNKMYARKLLVEVTQDYDIGGPNNRHDPRRGKPGIGGRNR